MGKQIYFILAVDLDTGEIVLDDDMADVRFPDGLVWDGEEWDKETDEEYENGYSKLRSVIGKDGSE